MPTAAVTGAEATPFDRAITEGEGVGVGAGVGAGASTGTTYAPFVVTFVIAVHAFMVM